MSATAANDRWVKIISSNGSMRAVAITAPALVREAAQRHGLSAAESVALGEALIAGLLLASRQKDHGRTSLSIKGSGRFKQVLIDGSASGTARGYLVTREAGGSVGEDRGPWGEGLISVVTQNPDDKEPYSGTCELATGHIAKDLTLYLTQSEQVPSAVGIAVDARPDGVINAAGGFIVEVMPGASDKEIRAIEQNLQIMDSIAQQLSYDENPTLLLANIFVEQTFTILEEKPVRFSCTCSRERVVNALYLLGEAEIADMIAKDHGAQVKCDFCNTEYNFTEEELRENYPQPREP